MKIQYYKKDCTTKSKRTREINLNIQKSQLILYRKNLVSKEVPKGYIERTTRNKMFFFPVSKQRPELPIRHLLIYTPFIIDLLA